MKRYFSISLACFCSVLLLAGAVWAKSTEHQHLSEAFQQVDLVGDVDGTANLPAKALQDTVWIADWTFDTGAPCDNTGWTRIDNRIQTDGITHWSVANTFAGLGGLTGNAALCGDHDLCFEDPTGNGYAAGWYTAIRVEYSGDTFLSFDYLVDSEAGFDFLQVEEDSACSSFSQVNYNVAPDLAAADFRNLLVQFSGVDTARVDSLPLSGFGVAGTHCVYIAFTSDGGFDPADGLNPTTLGIAAAVDNILLEPNGVGGTSLSENFEGALNPAVSFVNIQDSAPFGQWSRVFNHITDNDVCTEDPSCAWLTTDDTTPTIANDPSMAFAPGQFVIRNWLDDLEVSPWVSLASTPGATGTVLSFRRFPGNNFSTGEIVQNWAVRAKVKKDNTDSAAPGDSIDCITAWGHSTSWNSLSFFGWITSIANMEAHFDPNATDIQVRFRLSDWQWIVGNPPPGTFIPGPGAFWDRVRIGRRILSGPVINEGIDSRSQAQDAFPSDPVATTVAGINTWLPTTDRFGTVAFSEGTELGINNTSPNLLTGDSIHVEVQDVRGAGGVTSIDWYGCIVSGPHAGKAPPPHTVSGAFFVVPADTVKNASGTIVADNFFVSLDDQYFRGGDVLRYFWLAQDAQGGVTSDPVGMNAVPTTLAEAEGATGGLLEVNFLPTINWDAGYLARIAADANGKLDPTPAELAGSTQKNCILYVQTIASRRRSGDLNRTTFMYTLDNLGYRGSYDVYDHMGLGNTNNQLGGRATPDQAQGYSLIIYDMGNNGPSGFNMPDGSDLDAAKIDQGTWFQTWLGNAATSEAGIATLWVVGANAMEERTALPLYTTEMGVTFVGPDQGLNVNPDVSGQANMTFSNGNGGTFVGDLWSVNGGCPTIRNYDALGAVGTATVTHNWKDPNSATLGDAAIVMNANAAASWNTIMQAFPLFDMRSPLNASATPDKDLVNKVLTAVLPLACQEALDPTDVGDGDDTIDRVPARSALKQNIPNPFNPMTTIKFDLARDGRVGLKIYDVAGRLVRTLVDQKMTAGRDQSVVWNGLDNAGKRVSSGVYFYRLEAPDFTATRKMVVAK